MRYSLLLLLVIIFGCQPRYDVPVIIEIDENWEFHSEGDSLWYTAEVPGNIFSDLLDNKLIEDPFIGANEKAVQWVSDRQWEYRTKFNLDETTLNRSHLELIFNGLDTYASVYLNDSLILVANNAFREWQVDVKPLVRASNEIRVVFEPTSTHEDAEKAKLPYQLPEGSRVFTRKAQFQYGWDWGPRLNTAGIWRPVKLQAWNTINIDEIYVNQLGLDKDKADLLIDLNDIRQVNSDLTYEVFVNDSLYLEYENPNPESPVKIPLTIREPELWWPHNLGQPYLYDIEVVVRDGRKILDTVSVQKGLRTINLVTEKDSIGTSFYFNINGHPVYAKGANYIPQHSFQEKVRYSDYERLLQDAVEANMNMLRVWGGGIYEKDTFYELCDQKGILVWQDFMFACAMYPGDKRFLKNVQIEAQQQVKRLRNFASIAIWCGNNENAEGWARWGWQAGRSEQEKKEIWTNYLKVFDSILPKTVSNFSQSDYWESSPKYGRGNPKYLFEGDAHDWWVWHDAYPFEHFEEKVPRFMSEFGFQSYPGYEVMRYISQTDSLYLRSELIDNHQKHERGFQLIDTYMNRDYPVPELPEDYIYMSQLVQAHGITKGIEAHRRARPRNMGSLYWQLNDCWPAISWSGIDFFGHWKALHFQAKQSFKNVLVSSQLKDEVFRTWIVNDGLSPLQGDLKISITDFSGKELHQFSKEVIAESASSALKSEISLKDLGIDLKEVVIVSNFNGEERLNFLSPPKYLNLESAPITYTIDKTDNGYRIRLTSSTVQKDVFLYSPTKGQFSDNFFDMLPHKVYSLEFITKAESWNDLQLKSFNKFIR